MTNTVTIITGKQASGKTTLVNELTKGKETVFLTVSEIKTSKVLNEMNNNIECIVVEDFETADVKNLIKTINLRRHKQGNYKDAPNIFLTTSNKIKKTDFSEIKNVRFIKCSLQN